MTTEELIALRDAATPGPWVVERNKRTWGWVDVVGPSLPVGGPTQATDLTLADEVKRVAEAKLIAAAPDLAAEVLRLRAKEAAAVKLAEAVKHYRDFVLDHTGSGEVVPVITEPSSRLTLALAAWEAAK